MGVPPPPPTHTDNIGSAVLRYSHTHWIKNKNFSVLYNTNKTWKIEKLRKTPTPTIKLFIEKRSWN